MTGEGVNRFIEFVLEKVSLISANAVKLYLHSYIRSLLSRKKIDAIYDVIRSACYASKHRSTNIEYYVFLH